MPVMLLLLRWLVTGRGAEMVLVLAKLVARGRAAVSLPVRLRQRRLRHRSKTGLRSGVAEVGTAEFVHAVSKPARTTRSRGQWYSLAYAVTLIKNYS